MGLIDGVKIVKIISELSMFSELGIFIGLIIIAIALITLVFEERKLASGIAMIFGAMLIFFSVYVSIGLGFYDYEYVVLAEDNVKLNDFTRHYEIVSQFGDSIYQVRERIENK